MELAVAINFLSVTPPRFYQRGHLAWKTSRYKQTCNLRMAATESSMNGQCSVDGDRFVDVIGIGSRKEALLDFCMDSPFLLSSPFRFWNVSKQKPENWQLEERCVGTDVKPRVLEVPQLGSKAIILVASAGYGLTHLPIIDLLKIMKSRNEFSAAIFLNSFSFEGQRRQVEVKDLKRKLREIITFYVDIDTDSLLKKDMVTLDEALETANSAVVLAINAISILISEVHQKAVSVMHSDMKELKVVDVIKILRSCKEAKIGFGAGDNISIALLEALYDCPFIDDCSEDLSGILMLIIASSSSVEDTDVQASLTALRQATRFTGEIVVSRAYETKLEPSVIVTIVIESSIEPVAPEKSSFLSKLAQHAQHFTFIYNLLGGNRQAKNDVKGNDVHETMTTAKMTNSQDCASTGNAILLEDPTENGDLRELQRESTTDDKDQFNSRDHNDGAEEGKVGVDAATKYYEVAEAGPGFQREPLVRWNLAQEWAERRAGATPMLNDLSFLRLPVGVRTEEMLKDGTNFSCSLQLSDSTVEDNIKEQALLNPNNSSSGAMIDARSVATGGFFSKRSMTKHRNFGVRKKQGELSARAVSMLEAEREAPERWSPITEMQYRGGVYQGRCQGGLPEGKGRLVLGDGSIYDGMWHYGKRSGPGALYFCNGDVYQGSWRDDLMHGKGWLYFHTGDRWFANFWKGRANGESRFYSKSGNVFFGHFQDGWRHGQFLCIDVDGARYIEIWREGVLVSRKQEE